MFLLGVIVSLCYVPGLSGAYIATQWPVLSVALAFALAFRRGPFTVLHALGFLFVAYAAVRFFYPVPTYDGVFGLWLVTIMALCVWFGSTMETMRGLYSGLALGCTVSSIIAVFQYFGYHPVGAFTLEKMPGLYVNSVQQGAILSLLIVGLLSERMWYWVLPLLPGLFLANSRGAFLALVVGILGLYVRRVWLFGLLAIAGVFYLTVIPLSGSDAERWAIWVSAWQNLTLFGWGPGSFFTLVLYDARHAWFPEYAHNDALQLLFEYGIGAVPAFCVVAFALYCTGAKEWPVVVAFTVAGAYSMPLFMPLAAFIGLVAVGRVLRDYGMAITYGDHGRLDFLQRRRSGENARGRNISMASGHPTNRAAARG